MSEQNPPMICIKIKKGKNIYTIYGLKDVQTDIDGNVWFFIHTSQRQKNKDGFYFVKKSRIIDVRISTTSFMWDALIMKIAR